MSSLEERARNKVATNHAAAQSKPTDLSRTNELTRGELQAGADGTHNTCQAVFMQVCPRRRSSMGGGAVVRRWQSRRFISLHSAQRQRHVERAADQCVRRRTPRRNAINAWFQQTTSLDASIAMAKRLTKARDGLRQTTTNKSNPWDTAPFHKSKIPQFPKNHLHSAQFIQHLT
jgi:hypothetical protein